MAEETTSAEIKIGGETVILASYEQLSVLTNLGEWIVERPQVEGLEEFPSLLAQVLPVAISECGAPMRGINGVVKFTQEIDDNPPPDMTPAGLATCYTSPDGLEHLLFIRVSLRALELGEMVYPDVPISHQATKICLHELFETNYHLERESQGINPQPLKASNKKYSESGQEVYANRKALETLNKVLKTNYTLGGGHEGFLSHTALHL